MRTHPRFVRRRRAAAAHCPLLFLAASVHHAAARPLPLLPLPQILGEPHPFLPNDALLRGTSNFGSGDRMRRLGAKLLAGEPVTVAFLGGSITWGRVRARGLAKLALHSSCPPKAGSCLAACPLHGVHNRLRVPPNRPTAADAAVSLPPPPRAQGGNEGGSFVSRFTAWLNATFPHPGHSVVNYGLPAVTSALFAACYDKVPEVRGRPSFFLSFS